MPPSSNIAIRCMGITKSYRTDASITPALRGVNLEVREGELMMLVGPSGCGKTTLISVIAGILNQDGGSCELYGENINELSDRSRTRYRGKTIGFVFQAFNLIPTITVAENVAVPLLIAKTPFSQAVSHAMEMLDAVGLADKVHVLPRQLSGGQQQRVAIARSLVHGPRLIVCDEPTSSLDQETGHRVMELFRNLGLRDGRSLLIVTHDNRIFRFADRIAYMNDGVIEKVDTENRTAPH